MAAKLGRLVDIFSLAWDLAITELCSKKLSKLLDCNFTYNKHHLYVYWANYLFFWGFGFFTYKADTIITLEKKSVKNVCMEGCTIQHYNTFWWFPTRTRAKEETSSCLLLKEKEQLRVCCAPDWAIHSVYVTHSIFWMSPKNGYWGYQL